MCNYQCEYIWSLLVNHFNQLNFNFACRRCNETEDIKLSFTLEQPLSLSDRRMTKILMDEREIIIKLLHTDEKYPMLETLLNAWVRILFFRRFSALDTDSDF